MVSVSSYNLLKQWFQRRFTKFGPRKAPIRAYNAIYIYIMCNIYCIKNGLNNVSQEKSIVMMIDGVLIFSNCYLNVAGR